MIDNSIEYLELSVRLFNILKRYGIFYIPDIKVLDVLNHPKITKELFVELCVKLANYNGGKKLSFEEWMVLVDLEFISIFGCDTSELPDFYYHDLYDWGYNPEDVAHDYISDFDLL